MIKVADQNCLLPDPAGDLQRFLDRFLSVQGMKFFIPEPRRDEISIVSPTSADGDSIVLPLPNAKWPDPPKPEVNTLYWPTGASRWAHMLVIVDDDAKDAIVAAAHDSDAAQAVTVELSTSLKEQTFAANGFEAYSIPPEDPETEDPTPTADIGVQFDMHVLKPHPISITSGDYDKNAWVIPLVDERYLWQWKDVGEISEEDIPDWESLVNVIADSIGDDLIENIFTIDSDAFGWKPDIQGKKTFNYANSAMLLDAAVQSVGLRVVRQLNGDVQVLGPDDGATNWNNSYTSARDSELESWARIAGHEFHEERGGAGVPENVVSLFHMDNSIETVTATSKGVSESIAGFSKIVRIPYLPGGIEGEELNTLKAELSDKIAANYYAWLDIAGDVTFAGIKGWKFGGCEDALIVELGSFGRSGHPHMAQTRVQTLPSNFGISSILSSGQVSGGSGPIIIRFSIIYAIPSERYAVCFPTSAPSGYTFGVDTNIPGADDSGQITIYDRVGCFLDDNDPAVFIDREGYAVYLNSQTSLECEDSYGGLGWEMMHLCCDTTVCENI